MCFRWNISIDHVIRIQHIWHTVIFIIMVDVHVDFVFFFYIQYNR